MEKVIKLVESWVDNRDIARVIEFDRIIRREEFIEINQCMHDPRVIRTKTRKI